MAITSRGARPGYPLADVLFASSQTPIWVQIQHVLAARDALFPIVLLVEPTFATQAECVHMHLSDSILVDDVVLLTVMPNKIGPEQIVKWVQDIMFAVDEALVQHGYQLNYADGKHNGIIVYLMGKQQKSIREVIFALPDQTLPIPGYHHPLCINASYASYRHLGGLSNYRLDMDAETTHRTSLAHTAQAPLRKVLYRLPSLPLKP